MPSLRRPVVLVPLALVALLASVRALLAEDLDPVALLDKAKASVQAKQYGKALSDLQLAAAEVGRLRIAVLQSKFPAAPAGWTADEAEGQAGQTWLFGAGTNVKRRYHKGDQSSMDVDLWADSNAMWAGVQMVIGNPAFVQPGQQIVTIKGRRALLEFRKDDNAGSVSILLNAPNSLLRLEGNAIAKADLTDVFGNALDLDAIEKALQE
jgi:hypothetical protein